MTWQTADLPGIADRCFLGYKRCLLSYILEMTVSLASLLMTDYRRRVLGLLLLHPDRSFHLREIARLTGTVPGTLNRELTKLTDAGLLTRERVGNQMRYAASRDCPTPSRSWRASCARPARWPRFLRKGCYRSRIGSWRHLSLVRWQAATRPQAAILILW